MTRYCALGAAVVLIAGVSQAQGYATDFDYFAADTVAEALAVPGVTFTATPAQSWEILPSLFTTLTMGVLFQSSVPGTLDAAFATSVRRCSLRFSQNAPPGNSSVILQAFNGAIPVGSISQATTTGVSFGEGVVRFFSATPFDRIQISADPPTVFTAIDDLEALDAPEGTPSVGKPSVLSVMVLAGEPTNMIVSSVVYSPPLNPVVSGGVLLLRLDGSDNVVAQLGVMHDDGLDGDAIAGDDVFTARLGVTEPASGEMRLQTQATFQDGRVDSDVRAVPIGPGLPSGPLLARAADCPNVPDDACLDTIHGGMSLKDNADTATRNFSWKWSEGAVALTQADFGDPLNGDTNYRLCLYDQVGGSSGFRMGVVIPEGGICATKPCWKPLSTKGWRYKSKDGVSNGITRVIVKGGEGKSKIQVIGKGAHLALPTAATAVTYFNQDSAVIVQLHSSNPIGCWSIAFDASSTKSNDDMHFKAVTR